MNKPVLIIAGVLGVSHATLLAQTEPKFPQETRLIKFERPQNWTLQSRVILLAGESVESVATGRRYTQNQTQNDRKFEYEVWEYDEFVVVQPFVRSTASSMSSRALPTGKLELGKRVVDTEPTLIGPYHSQALYARWESSEPGSVRAMVMEQEMSYTSFETVFDEQAALQIPWPTEWPAEAASTMLPQQFVSLDTEGNTFDAADTTIDDLLAKWTEGQDSKSIPMVQLAKWIAGNVQETVNISYSGTTSRRIQDSEVSVATPTASGIEVQSAIETAKTGKGSIHDASVLLAAVYRKAGLPARLVIGYQKNERNGKRKVKSRERIRSWVEFAIYDEANEELTWVPVDVARMRKKSTRMRPMNQPWEYFGTHDELDDTVPIAFHFHPPTDVRSFGNPAMFGITMVPAPPTQGAQYITFTQTRTPVRPGG